MLNKKGGGLRFYYGGYTRFLIDILANNSVLQRDRRLLFPKILRKVELDDLLPRLIGDPGLEGDFCGGKAFL